MKVDIRNALSQIGASLRASGCRIGYRFVLTELSKHMTELGERYTAGDTKAVDEFLDLYCLRPEKPRTPVAALDLPALPESGTPSPLKDR